jgi:GNAT acetyltransferase-like protein
MIYELNENEYYKVRPLIKGIQDMNICLNGIIDGNNQGKIWVDNLDEPKVAIVWAIGCTYFIIGDIENEGFNNSLDSYITNVIGPDCLNTYGGTHFVVTLHEDKWEDKLDNIFNHRNPYKQYEYCYIFNENMYKELTKVQDNLPYGYTVKRIEKDIISNDTENLIADDILDGFWSSVDKFLDKGIGFCILKDNKIISNCFSGYVSGNLCEIVIRTYEEENERKGFGTFVARTFIDYCISNRIIPHWSTTEDNIGSTSIAEKCGFEIYKKFITYCFPFMKKQK